MCGKQKTIAKQNELTFDMAVDCLVKDRVEPESTQGVRSIGNSETTGGDGVVGCEPDGILEQVVQANNLFSAMERVIRNKGASGIDGMEVKDLQPYLANHYRELCDSILGGWYKPHPVRRVEIPKPEGGIRLLGVPTVIDRMIQQALVQILQPIFEQTFSDSSFGFRPKRSAHQAINRAKEYYESGYRSVVDLDLEKYFDTVNHELLLNMIMKTVKDIRVVRLIRKFLKSGVMINGLVSQTEEGTPQGGNLSPLLSNIYLSEFDKMLESRGHKFVRYADDCNIYVKSQRAAERVMEGCVKFIEGKLKLKVNRKKSTTGSPAKLKFLGFSLYKIRGNVGIRVHEKSLARFKDRLRNITSRKRSGTMEKILEELRRLINGWLGYYSIADIKKYLQQLSEWLRRRIRMMFWKRWKRIRTRLENLMRLGVSKSKAWQWANTRQSYWHIANSWILATTLNNQYLESIGFPKISERYEVLHSKHRTAVYGTVRTVV
ncbi:MAG: group II intron reverse transcriptase/maturase [Termitinemataceae bacterium]|nr:MAG: group II intron reverse transcriptase/maturase [Termitinemataceae bacterium]